MLMDVHRLKNDEEDLDEAKIVNKLRRRQRRFRWSSCEDLHLKRKNGKVVGLGAGMDGWRNMAGKVSGVSCEVGAASKVDTCWR